MESSSSVLPTISIRVLRQSTGPARDAELNKLRDACQDTGFFLVNECEEEVPQSLLDRAFANWEKLRSLPQEELRAISLDRTQDKSNRGFEGLEAQSLDPKSKVGDLNYSYRCTVDPDPTLNAHVPTPAPEWAKMYNQKNKWPSDSSVPGFKETSVAYLDGNWKVSKVVFGAIEEAFGLPKDFIVSRRTARLDIMRYLFYPKADAKEGQVGCGGHTDFGTGTFVRRRGEGTLWIEKRDGSLIETQTPDGYAIFNIGDMLQWWINGYLGKDTLVSTRHGVLAGQNDQSLVNFCYADYWQPLLDGVTAGDYQMQKVLESYRLKQGVM